MHGNTQNEILSMTGYYFVLWRKLIQINLSVTQEMDALNFARGKSLKRRIGSDIQGGRDINSYRFQHFTYPYIFLFLWDKKREEN